MTTPGEIVLTTHHRSSDYATTFRLNATSAMDDPRRDLPELVKIAVYRSALNESYLPEGVSVTECSSSFAPFRYSDAWANGTQFKFEHVEEIDLPHHYWSYHNGPKLHFEDSYRVNASEAENLPELNIRQLDVKNLQFFLTSSAFVTEWQDGNWINMEYGVGTALMGDVSLPDRFNKIAASMTDYLRNGPNHTLATGQRIEAVTWVSMRWNWLIGPCIIEASALLFSLLAILSNRRSRQVPLWKSSALSVLACWHDKGSGTIRSEGESLERDEDAKKLKAQLE